MKSIFIHLCLFFTIPLSVLGTLFNGICDMKGICSSSLELKHEQGTSKSANQCLKQCQSIEKCQWSTFDKRYRTCHLYKDCIEVTINNCEECTTSHVKCMDPLCDIPGYCEAYVMDSITMDTMFDCSRFCQSFLNCNWFSYGKELEICQVFNECPNIIQNNDFLTSQVDCQYREPGGKIIVYSGFPTENGKNVEIIDLLNPEAVCDTYAVLQEGVYYAFGGKVANEFVVCGGYTDVGTSKNCYKVGETAPIVELFQPRAVGSSVVLANNTLLLLGGYLSKGMTKSTELATIDPPMVKDGPVLPDYFRRHCSVLVEDKIFLIGGVDTQNTLLTIDVRTSAMTYKNELNHGRFDHACAQIIGSNGKKQIVVSGGRDGTKHGTTEIYEIEKDIWHQGPDLPEACIVGSMITSPRNNGVILLGCRNYEENIYQMAPDFNGAFVWSRMKQKLIYPRGASPIISYIDDDLTNCN